MKNDMCVTYPLWQMLGIIIIMASVLLIGYSTTFTKDIKGVGFEFVLPALAAIYTIVPISRMWMIIGILLIALGQYWIYYRTIKKFVSGES